MGVIAWLVLGLLAGAIAKAVLPGRDPGGLIGTTAIGIVGTDRPLGRSLRVTPTQNPSNRMPDASGRSSNCATVSRQWSSRTGRGGPGHGTAKRRTPFRTDLSTGNGPPGDSGTRGRLVALGGRA